MLDYQDVRSGRHQESCRAGVARGISVRRLTVVVAVSLAGCDPWLQTEPPLEEDPELQAIHREQVAAMKAVEAEQAASLRRIEEHNKAQAQAQADAQAQAARELDIIARFCTRMDEVIAIDPDNDAVDTILASRIPFGYGCAEQVLKSIQVDRALQRSVTLVGFAGCVTQTRTAREVLGCQDVSRNGSSPVFAYTLDDFFVRVLEGEGDVSGAFIELENVWVFRVDGGDHGIYLGVATSKKRAKAKETLALCVPAPNHAAALVVMEGKAAEAAAKVYGSFHGFNSDILIMTQCTWPD